MITQAYFENIQSHIIDELDKGKESIIVAVAWLTDKELFDKLCNKSASGVSVELMIFNDEINNKSQINFSKLETFGGKLYKIGNQNSQSLMHNKFCVIDFHTVITGSYNWSNKAKQNHENITVSKEATELAYQFTKEFQRLKQQYFEKDIQTTEFNLEKVIKRLSLVKNLIDLGDTEDIPIQVARLKQFESNESLENIIFNLDIKKYGEATKNIELFIKDNQKVTIYIDTEVNGLKLELKSSEIQLQSLSDEKTEMEKLVFNFNIRHTQELGEIIKEILEQRRIKAKTKTEKQEAKRDEEEYNQEYEIQKDIIVDDLTDEELVDLKKTYREASKLCHPDVVSEENKESAEKIFIELNEAYERNDIKKVKHVLQKLETGEAFISVSSESRKEITEKEQLKIRIDFLRNKIHEILTELYEIEESYEYQKIISIENWDTYFKEQKAQLEDTLKQLKDGKLKKRAYTE